MSHISKVYKGSIYSTGRVKGKGKAKHNTRPCVMQRTVKGILGYCQQDGVSLFTLIVKCLAKQGIYKPEGISDKAFAKQNFNKLTRHDDPKTTVRLVISNKPDVASSDFLQSYEWRKLRMEAIKKYGNKCQCCGASAATGAVINVDHIKPRKLHPELALDINNLQILCGDCNHGKGNWDQTDWRVSAKN